MSRKGKYGGMEKAARGAPAYMGQYASLMTILLAFFIIMLTLGQDRVAQFKVGVGLIHNMIGLTGGAGVLEFWRSARRPPAPRVYRPDTEDPAARLIGREAESRESFSLGGPGVEQISFLSLRGTVRLRSPIRFESGRIRVARASQSALDHAGTLLYALPEHRIVVEVREIVDEGDLSSGRLLAARRAAWLTRHLIEHARIPPGQIRAMGMVGSPSSAVASGDAEVFFWLKRDDGAMGFPEETPVY